MSPKLVGEFQGNPTEDAAGVLRAIMSDPLGEGRTVVLKCGGSIMVVEKLRRVGSVDLVDCVWMVDGLVQRDTFHRLALLVC